MSDTRIIKKYPNRRLYDSEQSRYITLAEVRQLVMAGVDFEVRDANSGDDLTRSLLLQIIAEQEAGTGNPVFTNEMLTQIIRSYGDAMDGVFGNFLQRSFELFGQSQSAFQEAVEKAAGSNPWTSMMTEMTRRNIEAWQGFGAPPAAGQDPDKDKSGS
ncbi:MAG: polyhydroxyalkanoate synthesis repressor PhaR [Gammaproteobacteria bacterium]|nr:polyhydroxyalkanoate synthesis repressor PhaR [Gammaproteobacteria bacterium]